MYEGKWRYIAIFLFSTYQMMGRASWGILFGVVGKSIRCLSISLSIDVIMVYQTVSSQIDPFWTRSHKTPHIVYLLDVEEMTFQASQELKMYERLDSSASHSTGDRKSVV